MGFQRFIIKSLEVVGMKWKDTDDTGSSENGEGGIF